VAAGRLGDALELYHEALTFEAISRSIPALGAAYVGVADILRERNELTAAREHLTHGNALARQGLMLVLRAGALVELNIQLTLGDQEGMRTALRTAEQLARQHPFAPFARELAIYRARLDLIRGDLDAAAAWAESCDGDARGSTGMLGELEALTVARVRSAQGHRDAALALLSDRLRAAETAGRAGSLIAILTVEALVRAVHDDTLKALVALGRALALAEPEQYIRVFADEGPPMVQLLHTLLARDGSREYVRILLGVLTGTTADRSAVNRSEVPAKGLVEPLSERERDVLRLLAAGLTNVEIAHELVVALPTIKTHLQHIYSKLAVHGRREAVIRARQLKVI
jgi:LuxR family maltose regulon positive regulatory protein